MKVKFFCGFHEYTSSLWEEFCAGAARGRFCHTNKLDCLEEDKLGLMTVIKSTY